MSQERATVDEYNDLLAEVERLRAIIGDQQTLLDEHGMDNRHAYEEGGNDERASIKLTPSSAASTAGRRMNEHQEVSGEPTLPNCPYCASPVRVYQEHPDHRGWYAECSSPQQCVGTWTCFSREEAEKAWMKIESETPSTVRGLRSREEKEE